MSETTDRDSVAPTGSLSPDQLRDLIVRAHGMATADYIQSDTVMRARIGRMLGDAIAKDDTMRSILQWPLVDAEEAAPKRLGRTNRIGVGQYVGQ